MVGSTWSRVRSTLESDYLPALSQGTASFHLVVDWLFVLFIVAAHIRCLVIGVVLVRIDGSSVFLSCLCGPGGYPYVHMSVRFHGSLYPMTDLPYAFDVDFLPPCLLMFHGGSLRFHY